MVLYSIDSIVFHLCFALISIIKELIYTLDALEYAQQSLDFVECHVSLSSFLSICVSEYSNIYIQ